MTDHSIVHGSFTVERTYPVPPARVFAAWADPKLKSKWFGDPGAAENPSSIFDFREGGREYSEGSGPNGQSYTFDVSYKDIVPDNRIIYAYEMSLDGQRISVSVATVEFKPKDDGTQMIVHEMGAFLDGLDKNEDRKAGTEWLMDQLGKFLAGPN